MTTLEKIRAEIKEELEDSIRWGGDQLYNAALKKALEIIDKYVDQEPTEEQHKPHSLLDAYFQMREESHERL